MDMVLKIYDEKGKEVVREVAASTFDIMFGTIQELMELLDIENTENNLEILGKVTGAWKELTGLLDTVFPGVSREEWKRVKVKELLPLLLGIVKFSFEEMLSVPTDPNKQGA